MIILIQQVLTKARKRGYKKGRKSTLTSTLLLIFYSSFSYADISVIVNKSNNNVVSTSDIRKIFLGKKIGFADGSPAIPLIHEELSEQARHFNSVLLKRSPQQYKSYWARMIFTGKMRPPEETYSDEETIDRTATNPSIISYIKSSSLTNEIKEILRIKKQ
ncbi:MAG: phosphate ABC transporter substrate-binding protein [Gammaproteobacteria bacterium]|nr:phosphate ABC transporter substrate-binding protein [Gammaproteobacteria bacterium]